MIGEEVRVVLPLYGSVDGTSFTDLPFHGEVSLLGSKEEVTFCETRRGKVTYYFVQHPSTLIERGFMVILLLLHTMTISNVSHC